MNTPFHDRVSAAGVSLLREILKDQIVGAVCQRSREETPSHISWWGASELTDTAGKANEYYIQYVTFINPKEISWQKTNYLWAAQCRAITLSELFEVSKRILR
jgi:hypothetical protein